jgi:colanic acid/amylovoran biosynthesis glycosyltransferase
MCRYLWARRSRVPPGPVGRIEAALAALRPAVVHFQSAIAARDCLDLKAALGWKAVVSVTGEDLNMVGLDRPDYYRGVWEAADLLHVPDESLWRRALRRGCDPDHRRALIGPAADFAHFRPLESDTTEGDHARLRILSVGPLVWAQGYEDALHAARLLLDRGVDFEYRIVGEGEHLPALTFARYQLGLEGRVQLRPPGISGELRADLRWADVFLNAAVAEGFKEAMAEAHAMALAVVASERGVLDEAMAYDAVLVAPRRDPHALAERLAQVAADAPLRRRLGQRGRERAMEGFDLPRQLDAFERLYREAESIG